jgi:Ca2+/H+ antiporter, TMEM165/GDT1 family
MNPALAYTVAAVPAFIASAVEFVEAYTIVVAVGNTRGWRAPLWGTAAAILTLAVVIVAFGAPLVRYHDQVSQSFHLFVGVLLLLFGMRWLRKAILRFAGIIALHDEELIYQREVAELRARGLSPTRWDNAGFWLSYKAMLLEGLEVAFIIIALGSRGDTSLAASIGGAVAAFVLVTSIAALVRGPLTAVPENWMKFTVGAMLVTFGIYWGAEGVGVHWALEAGTLPLLFAGVSLVTWGAVRMLRQLLPHGARVAARTI